MICPNCAHHKVVVKDSRKSNTSVERRRACVLCDYRWSTVERVMTSRDGSEALNFEQYFGKMILKRGSTKARLLISTLMTRVISRIEIGSGLDFDGKPYQDPSASNLPELTSKKHPNNRASRLAAKS